MSLKLTSYKGTRDLYPVDMAERNYIFAGWRKVVESYGYQEYMTPLLEPIEMYAAKSGQEIVNDQTYSFVDRGSRQMTIRPEMTPSVSRLVAAKRQDLPMPARLYSIANFMRYERPQHGREREFWQLNFDLFGIDNIQAELEIIEMSNDILTSFGASKDMFTIKVNDRRLTDHIMREYLALDGDQAPMLIKLLDRFDKLPATVFEEQAKQILCGDLAKLEKFKSLLMVKTIDDLPGAMSTADITKPLRDLLAKLHQNGISNAIYDIKLMRGFDYYTGIVFEVFDEAPENRRAMFGGGRYDGLVSLFGVESLPVVGVAPGETTFREFLIAHKLLPDFTASCGPDVTILPLTHEQNDQAMAIAKTIRSVGITVSVDYTDRKIDKKTRVAVKNKAKLVVYLGESEIASGKITVKDLGTGWQEQIAADDLPGYLRLKCLTSVANDKDNSEEE